MSHSEPHDEFLELCAISTSGELTEEEQNKLEGHLAVCQSCREAIQQYQAVVNHAIPAIAASEASESGEPAPDWSKEQAERDFFKRLAQEKRREPYQFGNTAEMSAVYPGVPPFAGQTDWGYVWMSYTAGILLFLSLSIYTYRVGFHRGSDTAELSAALPGLQRHSTLEAELSDAGHERQVVLTQIEQRDNTIARLRRQLAGQVNAIQQMKSAQDRLKTDLTAVAVGREDLAQKTRDLAQKLEAAQSSSQALQRNLDSLAQQSAEDGGRAKALEAKVSDLAELLRDRESALEQKDELLAHDRDIRELMGARDLYVAEVYDVMRNGETRKPYGRVFYTKGKSLIFYAYDLDRESETKAASTFQAWGRRGPDLEQALNLGIFYQDSASKKRWILKCDDPKTLAQIDAVFVTIEPDRTSHQPSGKSLLFAYLKGDPNHP